MLELVSQGTSITEAKDAERYLPEGANAELRLYLSKSAPGWVVWSLEQSLELAGVPLREPVKQGANIITIKWRKGFPWLPVIVVVVVAALVLAALIVSWQLFKEVVANPFVGIAVGLVALGIVMIYTRGSQRRGVGYGR